MYAATDFITGMSLLYLFFRQGRALEEYEAMEYIKPNSNYTPSYNTEHIRKIIDRHHFSEFGSLRSDIISGSKYQMTKAPTKSLQESSGTVHSEQEIEQEIIKEKSEQSESSNNNEEYFKRYLHH